MINCFIIGFFQKSSFEILENLFAIVISSVIRIAVVVAIITIIRVPVPVPIVGIPSLSSSLSFGVSLRSSLWCGLRCG